LKRKPTSRPQADQLPSDLEALQAMILELLDENARLKRMLFGRRSEKLHDDPSQGVLFGREEPQGEQASEEEPEEDEEPARQRRRRTRHRGRRPLPADLMRCIHDIHPPDEELTCPCCGTSKTIFSQDVTEELEMIPAKYFVNRYVRHKYACPRCEGYVSEGPLPPRPIDKGIPGPGFLADLITSKYAEHLPLHRLQERYRRLGMTFARSTLCGWVGHVASLLLPVVEAMKLAVLASRKVHTDDTPIVVLDPNVKPVGSRKGYMWVYIGDHDDVVFEYTNSRKRDGPESFLKGYRGYLQADAFSGYDRIYTGGYVIEVACWAHARRKFYEAQTSHGPEARRVLELIGRLYAVESRAKGIGVRPETLLAWRQRFSRRRLERLRVELDRLSLSVLPRSPLGKAITYTLNQWKALTRYTQAPYLSIDNNHSERQIKQMVIGRKNWLFAGSENGARNAAVLFSVVVSCKLAGVDPFVYLHDVLTRIHTHPADRVHELTPRLWKNRFGATGPQDAPAAA
jgi:transposase